MTESKVCDYRAGVCAWAKTFNKEVGAAKEFEKYSRCGYKQGVGSHKVIREPKSVESMERREGGGNGSGEVVGGELFDRVGGPITGGEVKCQGDGSAIRSVAGIGGPKAGGFRVLVVVVWDSEGRATRCGSRGRCSPVTKCEAVIGGGRGGVLRARNREDSNRLRVRGGSYLEDFIRWRPIFITQYGGREVAG